VANPELTVFLVKGAAALAFGIAARVFGYPLARAEAPITIEGVSLDLNGRWIATLVNHDWSFESGGATTEIIAEFGADDDDAAAS
jgi:hypothetical protein